MKTKATQAAAIATQAPQGATGADSGSFPMWAALPRVERRPAAALLRDIAEAAAADSIFQ